MFRIQIFELFFLIFKTFVNLSQHKILGQVLLCFFEELNLLIQMEKKQCVKPEAYKQNVNKKLNIKLPDAALKKPQDFPMGELFNAKKQVTPKQKAVEKPVNAPRQQQHRPASLPTQPLQHKPSLHCRSGHLLALVSSLPPQYVNQQYKCDSCRGESLADKVPVWHCNSCNYDLCYNCADKLIKNQKKAHIQQKNIKAVAMMCNQSPDKIMFQQVSNLAVNFAQQAIFSNPVEIYTPCCPMGHKLQALNALPLIYGGLYSCDRCKQNKALTDYVWHCDACMFDICRVCMGR